MTLGSDPNWHKVTQTWTVPRGTYSGGSAPRPRYQSASGLPSYALAPDVRKASKKSFFLDILAPGRAMLHPDGLLGKRSLKQKKTSLRGDAVHRTACFYQVLIDIWSIVPFVGLFIHILNILLKIVENCWNMSFPMFVWSFREIPKAKLMSEVLFTIPDTSQGPKYIGKHHLVLFLY